MNVTKARAVFQSIVSFFLLAMILCSTAFSKGHHAKTGSEMSRPFSAGIILGAPTALSAKLFLDRKAALDFGFGFLFGNSFMIYGDYLYHFPQGFGTSSEFVSQLTPYVGLGPELIFASYYNVNGYYGYWGSTSSFGAAIRIPFGIEWKPAKPPIGVFLEFVPAIGVIPGFYSLFQGGIGARWYF